MDKRRGFIRPLWSILTLVESVWSPSFVSNFLRYAGNAAAAAGLLSNLTCNQVQCNAYATHGLIPPISAVVWQKLIKQGPQAYNKASTHKTCNDSCA